MAWIYLTDNCDHAGIWPAAFDLMSSDIGIRVDEERLQTWFGDKVIQISDDKFFLPGYIEFQYGELSEESKPHVSVIKILQKYKIDPKNLTLLEEYPKGLGTLKDKDKEKAKDNSLGKGEGKTLSSADARSGLDAIYATYPRKEGKSPGMRTLKSQIKTLDDLRELDEAVARYTANCKAKGKEGEFVLMWSTFANQWRDWLDPDTGQSHDFSKTSKGIAELLAEEGRDVAG